jgi:hypothetical protein
MPRGVASVPRCPPVIIERLAVSMANCIEKTAFGIGR